MATAVGPVFTGGYEEFVVDDESGERYSILFLPDLNNQHLQKQGDPPVYYWIPGYVRLARKGDVGDYKFRHLHFVGVLDPEQHIGAEGNSEVVGGLVSFTTTSRYPTAVLQQANEQLLAKFRGDDDRYWGWTTPAAPQFRIAPITSNTTAITNLAPGRDGLAPAEGGAGAGAPGAPRTDRNLEVRPMVENGPVPHMRNVARPRSNLDAWAFELEGAGPGSVTGGESAYSGLVGQYPSELIWAGFRGGFSPMAAAQNLILPMWSQEIYVRIEGHWDRIFEHYSAAFGASAKLWSAEIKAEFNNLRLKGGIEVEVSVDGTRPEGDKQVEAINKRIDVITDQFMKQALQVIFTPAPLVEAAKPSGGRLSNIFGSPGGFVMNYRRDTAKLKLKYEETRNFRYNQPTTISSTLDGLAAEIAADPAAADKYFKRLILGDIARKVHRTVKPVVNWPDPARNWVGQPVSFLSVQVGYPDEHGVPQWDPHVFQSTDTDEQTMWQSVFARRNADEVTNAPEGWAPDMTFVRRKVHLKEHPGAFDNPNVRLSIEKNEVLLDPGENGSLLNDMVLEVRADRVGVLEVGPIAIDVELENANQIVEVTFKALGNTLDGQEREAVRFSWDQQSQREPRFWKIYTGDLDYAPEYDYKVRVIVKGSIISAGMEWEGPWISGQGNGPLMVSVPTPDGEYVVQRRFTPREISLLEPASADREAVLTPGAPDGDRAGAAIGAPPGERTVAGRRVRREEVAEIEEVVAATAATSARSAPKGGTRTRRASSAKRSDRTEGDQEAGPVLAEGWSLYRED